MFNKGYSHIEFTIHPKTSNRVIRYIIEHTNVNIIRLVYKQRKLLRADAKNNFNPKNQLNGKFIYIKERLSTIETLIKRLCEEMGYITSSYKCNISVLCCDNIDPTGENKCASEKG